jgi:hypothetical protein
MGAKSLNADVPRLDAAVVIATYNSPLITCNEIQKKCGLNTNK